MAGAPARATVGVVLAAALLTACGGPARLSPDAYVARANRECRSLEAAGAEFAELQDPDLRGHDVARVLRRAADRLDDLVQRLAELEPPEFMESDADRLVERLGSYVEGLDELADRTDPRQTFRELQAEQARLVDRLNRVAGAATALVAELGLVDCILAP